MPRRRWLVASTLLALLLSGVGRAAVGDAADGRWTDVRPPPYRSLEAAAYDPIREQMVVVGGFAPYAKVHNEVWVFSFATEFWSQMRITGPSPAPRRDHSLVYDDAGDRFILFGGWDQSRFLNDVWALSFGPSGPAWEPLQPSGTDPSARSEHAAVFDPRRRRMVVIGGHGASGRPADVWQLHLSGSPTWSRVEVSGSGPADRHSHTATYDPVRDRVLVVGGWDSATHSDVWQLSLGGSPSWLPILPAGEPPPPRKDHHVTYDPVHDRFLVVMGVGDSLLDDVWALDPRGGGLWSRVVPSGPAPAARRDAVAVYDSPRDRLLLLGGWSGEPRRDFWALEGASAPRWTQILPRQIPSPRSGHVAVVDTKNDRAVIYGGSFFPPADYTWTVSLTNPYEVTPVDPAGMPLSNLGGQSAVCDPDGPRMIVFGGGFTAGGSTNRVWELSLDGEPRWTERFPEGEAPRGRSGHFAVYDSHERRMIVFGGNHYDPLTNRTDYFGDAWTLALGEPLRWTPLAPAGPNPGARTHGSAVYDPDHRRMIVHAGHGPVPPYGIERLNDVWALNLEGETAWEKLEPAGAPPNPRWGQSTIYDSRRGRMVIYGGSESYTGGLGDTWELSLRDSVSWRRLEPVGDEVWIGGHAAIYDPLRDRMVALLNGEWTRVLQWEGYSQPPVTGSLQFRVGRVFPNPSTRAAEVVLDVTAAANVKVEVYDVSGRLVRVLADGSLMAGSHSFSWDGRAAHAPSVPPGLYFLRVAVEGKAVTRKVVRW